MPARRTGFTTRASCLLAAGVTAILCGLVLGEVDLVRAGVLAAAIPVVATLVVQRSRVRITNRRRVEPVWTVAGEPVTVHLVITNRSMLRTGALMLEDQLPGRLTGRARFVLDPLSGRESRTVSYRIPGLGRGHYRVGPLRVRLSDPFGMVDLSRSFTATSEFLVTPAIDRLPELQPARSDDIGGSAGSHSVGTHGADDQSTREYRIGDDLRKIHWRSSARTGALMVRQEERPWRGQSTVLLDLRATAHETDPAAPAEVDPRLASSLEWAISAAASVGAHLLHSGRELALITEPGEEREKVADRGELASRLAAVHELRNADLAPLAGPLRTAARDSALIAVLGRLDPITLRTLADIHPRGRSAPAIAMLLDVDSWREPVPGPVLATAPSTSHSTPPSTPPVAAQAGVLRNAGWQVVVVRHGQPIAHVWQLLLGRAGAQTWATVPR